MARTPAKNTTQAPKGATQDKESIAQTANDAVKLNEVLQDLAGQKSDHPPPVNEEQSTQDVLPPPVNDTKTQPDPANVNIDTSDSSLEKATKQAIAEGRMFLVQSIGNRFFRCGMAFTKEGEVVELTDEQIQIIQSEPHLKMRQVTGIEE